AARTIASVKKDETTFGLLRFLKKEPKEQIEKQIRANDAKKLAASDNENRAIWEIVNSRTNSKCDVTSESLPSGVTNKFLVEIEEKLSKETRSKTHSSEELIRNKIIRQARSMFFAPTTPGEIVQIVSQMKTKTSG
ncbi:hypothetical protein HHI36_002767, partial [Cryptolaemus montrouzieri]